MVFTLRLSVLHGRLACKTLIDWSRMTGVGVFTARYALSPYIKQINFVSKWLISYLNLAAFIPLWTHDKFY